MILRSNRVQVFSEFHNLRGAIHNIYNLVSLDTDRTKVGAMCLEAFTKY